jgi:hypothetical protein
LSLSGTQTTARLTLKTDLVETAHPVTLVVEGRAKIGGADVVHEAVAAEDRMQAFLWRHLVPAEELKVVVSGPTYEPPKRARRNPMPPAVAPAVPPKAPEVATNPSAVKPKFTKQQVAARLKQIQALFDTGYLTEEFSDRKAAECEAGQ